MNKNPMREAAAKQSIDLLEVTSSVADDVWHASEEQGAHEWWYFDALSSGGKDAVIIKFGTGLVGYTFASGKGEKQSSVSFAYVRDGKVVCCTARDYGREEFSADANGPNCRIGESTIEFDKTDYGTGYRIEIAARLPGGGDVTAAFEWLLIESDIIPHAARTETGHRWNVVAPRSDVTGKISVSDRKGKKELYQFRGSGYHDHNHDERSFFSHVREWHRGRVHYADATAIFCRYDEFGSSHPENRLLIVRDGTTREKAVEYDIQEYSRGRFGTKYPSRIRLVTDDNIRLRVKPFKLMETGRFCQRFLSEMTLTLRDGIPRRANGLVEFISPGFARFRLLNLLNTRRGRP